jgi:hypothetical protein
MGVSPMLLPFLVVSLAVSFVEQAFQPVPRVFTFAHLQAQIGKP